MIANTTITVTKLCSLLVVSHPTISKARKELGIATIRGRRAGSVMPSNKGTTVECHNPLCKIKLRPLPSRPRKYCSTSCQMKTNNNTKRGVGSRKMRNPNTPEYKRYSRMVHRRSHEVYLENIDIINPTRHVRTLCGVKGGYQLDHIITIKECFEKKVTVEEASTVTNLRMLPWRTNLMRNFKDLGK